MRSSARAPASCSASLAPAGTFTRARTLPSTCTGISTSSTTRYAGSGSGNSSYASDSAWPRRAHISSARCAASGASISVMAATTSRAAAPPPPPTRRPRLRRARREPVVQLDQARDRGVELELRHVGPHRGDRPMEDAPSLLVGGRVRHADRARLLVDGVAPEPLQEPVHADDVGRVPGPAGVERPHEHLVEAERVGAVVGIDVVGRDRVLPALAHPALLAGDLPAFEEELPPSFFDLVGGHVHAPVVEVLVRRDGALIEQPREGLRRRNVTEVVEHLVPEP